MTTDRLPHARRDDLIVRDLETEVLLYDRRNQQVRCLNRSAALIWQHCDGVTTAQAMVDILTRELGAEADADMVSIGLTKLDYAGLLEEGASAAIHEPRSTRRQTFAKLAAMGAAFLLPTVMSVSMGQAASQQLPSPPPEEPDAG